MGKDWAAKDWARLATAVGDRRRQLALSQTAVRDAGGPSDVVVGRIEQNDHRAGYPRQDTIHKLDAGLQWAPGSAIAILNGGEPTPLDRTPESVGDALTEDLLLELLGRIVPGTDDLTAQPPSLPHEGKSGRASFRDGLRRAFGQDSGVRRGEDDSEGRQFRRG